MRNSVFSPEIGERSVFFMGPIGIQWRSLALSEHRRRCIFIGDLGWQSMQLFLFFARAADQERPDP
eukprot:3004360-Pyramimonas_sp.AAC.1